MAAVTAVSSGLRQEMGHTWFQSFHCSRDAGACFVTCKTASELTPHHSAVTLGICMPGVWCLWNRTGGISQAYAFYGKAGNHYVNRGQVRPVMQGACKRVTAVYDSLLMSCQWDVTAHLNNLQLQLVLLHYSRYSLWQMLVLLRFGISNPSSLSGKVMTTCWL